MNIDRFAKNKDHKHLCPFCNLEIAVSNNDYYKNNQMVGYECLNCSVIKAHDISGKLFSRYNIGVMENLQLNAEMFFEQLIVEENFYMPDKIDQWWNVSNNLKKGQTSIVLTRPVTQNDFFYQGETPAGLMWLGNLIHLPLIDSWNLSDQERTLSKLKTYLLFL